MGGRNYYPFWRIDNNVRYIQNIREPSLVSDNEVRPFTGRDTILISLERELIRRLDVLPTISVYLKLELPGSISKGVTDPVVTPGPLRPRERAHTSICTSLLLSQRVIPRGVISSSRVPPGNYISSNHLQRLSHDTRVPC